MTFHELDTVVLKETCRSMISGVATSAQSYIGTGRTLLKWNSCALRGGRRP